MRLLTEGTLAMTGSTLGIGSLTGVASALVWLGAGDSNAATIRVGKSAAPQLPVETTDKKGFTIPESDFNGLVALGTASDILRYAVWG